MPRTWVPYDNCCICLLNEFHKLCALHELMMLLQFRANVEWWKGGWVLGSGTWLRKELLKDEIHLTF